MKKEEERPILRWGDIIQFRNAQSEGSITCSGFFGCDIIQRVHSDSATNIKQHKQSLFQVLPVQKVHDGHEATTEKMSSSDIDLSETSPERQKSHLERQQGSVLFEDDVLLLSLEWNAYLCVTTAKDEYSSDESELATVSLTSTLSDDAVWHISSTQDGKEQEKIELQERMILCHVRTASVLGAEQGEAKEFSQENQQQSKIQQYDEESSKFLNNRPQLTPDKYSYRQINVSEDNQDLWLIHVFGEEGELKLQGKQQGELMKKYFSSGNAAIVDFINMCIDHMEWERTKYYNGDYYDQDGESRYTFTYHFPPRLFKVSSYLERIRLLLQSGSQSLGSVSKKAEYKKRQEACAEAGIIKLIAQLLYHLSPAIFQAYSNGRVNQFLKKLSIQAFSLLSLMIDNSSITTSAVIDHFKVWIKFALGVDDPLVDTFFDKLLKRLGNEADKCITTQQIDDFIKNFMQLLDRLPKQSVIPCKHLRILTGYLDSAKSKKKQWQKRFMNCFFLNVQNLCVPKFREVKKEGENKQEVRQVQVLVEKKQKYPRWDAEPEVPQYLNLQEFKQQHPNQWEYLVSFLELLASACHQNEALSKIGQSYVSLDWICLIVHQSKPKKKEENLGNKKVRKHSVLPQGLEMETNIQDCLTALTKLAHSLYFSKQQTSGATSGDIFTYEDLKFSCPPQQIQILRAISTKSQAQLEKEQFSMLNYAFQTLIQTPNATLELINALIDLIISPEGIRIWRDRLSAEDLFRCATLVIMNCKAYLRDKSKSTDIVQTCLTKVHSLMRIFFQIDQERRAHQLSSCFYETYLNPTLKHVNQQLDKANWKGQLSQERNQLAKKHHYCSPDHSQPSEMQIFWASKVKEVNADTSKNDKKLYNVLINELLTLSGQNQAPWVSSFAVKMFRLLARKDEQTVERLRNGVICLGGQLQVVNTVVSLLKIKSNKLDISSLTDNNTIDIVLWKKINLETLDDLRECGIIQYIDILCSSCKAELGICQMNNLVAEYQDFNGAQSLSWINQKDEANNLAQKLICNQKIDEFCISVLEYLRRQTSLTYNIKRLLMAVNKMLTHLYFRNTHDIRRISKLIDATLRWLPFSQLGSVVLLYHLLSDQTDLLGNQALVNRLMKTVLDQLITNQQKQLQQQGNYREQGWLWLVLRNLVASQGKVDSDNQLMLTSLLFSADYKTLLLTQPSKQNKSNYHSHSNPDLGMTNQDKYYAAYFDLIALLASSPSPANLEELRRLYPLRLCLEYIESTTRYQLLRPLRAVINRLHYFQQMIKPKMTQIASDFIHRDLKIMSAILKNVVDLFRYQQVRASIVSPGNRFHFAISQIQLLVREILHSINHCLHQEHIHSSLSLLLSSHNEQSPNNGLQLLFCDMLRSVGCLRKAFPANTHFTAPIQQAQEILTKYIRSVDTLTLQQYVEGPNQDEIDEYRDKKPLTLDQNKSFFKNLKVWLHEITEIQLKQVALMRLRRSDWYKGSDQQKKQGLIQTIVDAIDVRVMCIDKDKQQIIFPPIVRRNAFPEPSLSQLNHLPSKSSQQNSQNKKINQDLSGLNKLLNSSELIKQISKESFYHFINIITLISRKQKEHTGTINQLPQFFSNSFEAVSSGAIKDSEDVEFCLQLVTAFVTEFVEESQFYKVPIEHWTPPYYSSKERRLGICQQLLHSKHGIDLLVHLLSEHSSGACLADAVQFGVTLLIGPHNMQGDMKTIAKAVPVVWRQLGKRCSFLIQYYSPKQQQLSPHEEVDCFSIFDREDYVISRPHVDSIQAQRSQRDAWLLLNRVLQFERLVHSHQITHNKTCDLTDSAQSLNLFVDLIKRCLVLRPGNQDRPLPVVNNDLASLTIKLTELIKLQVGSGNINSQLSLVSTQYLSHCDLLFQLLAMEEFLQSSFRAKTNTVSISKACQLCSRMLQVVAELIQGQSERVIGQLLGQLSPNFFWAAFKLSLVMMRSQQIAKSMSEENMEYRGGFSLVMVQIQRFQTAEIGQFIQKYFWEQDQSNPEASVGLNLALQTLVILKKVEDYGQRVVKKGVLSQSKLQLAKKALQLPVKVVKHIQQSAQFSSYQHFLLSLQKLLLSVVVRHSNNEGERHQSVFFPNKPIFQYLSQTTKDTIILQADRDSQQTKLKSLIKAKPEVFNEMAQYKSLQNNYFEFKRYQKPKKGEKKKPLIKKKTQKDGKKTFKIPVNYQNMQVYEQVSTSLAFFLVQVSLTCLAFDYLSGGMLSSAQNLGKILKAVIVAITIGQSISQFVFWGTSFTVKLPLLIQKLRSKQERLKGQEKLQFPLTYKKSNNQWKAYYYSDEELANMLYFSIAAFNIMTLGPRNPVHFSYIKYLFILKLVSNRKLSHIIRKFIGLMWKILIALAVLSVLLFSLQYLWNWSENFRQLQSAISGSACDSDLMNCSNQVFSWQQILSGLTEIVYWFVLVWLAYQVIKSMFKSDKELEVERERAVVCYVTGMDASQVHFSLQKIQQFSKETFAKHCQKHDQWNYLFYLHYIESLPHNTKTTLENTIQLKVGKQEVDWFPNKRDYQRS